MENGTKVNLILEKSVKGNEEFFDVTMSQTNDDGKIEISDITRYLDIVAATKHISITYGRILPKTIHLTIDEERYVVERLGNKDRCVDVV